LGSAARTLLQASTAAEVTRALNTSSCLKKKIEGKDDAISFILETFGGHKI
jgi:hypothetical protein